jgi:hypothetical protein
MRILIHLLSNAHPPQNQRGIERATGEIPNRFSENSTKSPTTAKTMVKKDVITLGTLKK